MEKIVYFIKQSGSNEYEIPANKFQDYIEIFEESDLFFQFKLWELRGYKVIVK